jgi:hypothetical protein
VTEFGRGYFSIRRAIVNARAQVPIAPGEQKLGAGLEGLRTRDRELEHIGDAVRHVESETNCERIFDLRARGAGRR